MDVLTGEKHPASVSHRHTKLKSPAGSNFDDYYNPKLKRAYEAFGRRVQRKRKDVGFKRAFRRDSHGRFSSGGGGGGTSIGGSGSPSRVMAGIHDAAKRRGRDWTIRGDGAAIRGPRGHATVKPIGGDAEVRIFGPTQRTARSSRRFGDVGEAMTHAERETGARGGIKLGPTARSSTPDRTRVPELVKQSPFERGPTGETLKRAPVRPVGKPSLAFVKELTEELRGEKHPGNHDQSVHGKGGRGGGAVADYASRHGGATGRHGGLPMFARGAAPTPKPGDLKRMAGAKKKPVQGNVPYGTPGNPRSPAAITRMMERRARRDAKRKSPERKVVENIAGGAARKVGRALDYALSGTMYAIDKLTMGESRLHRGMPKKGRKELRDLTRMLRGEHDVDEFTFTKDAKTGQLRWFSVVSNNFEDRDGELFEERAHKDYVDYVDQTGDYPELWLWHTPGTRFGVADMVAYTDHFLIATGTIDGDKEHVAQSLARAGVKAVSHGYRYRRKDLSWDGTYSRYKTFEISVLPNHRASNAFTLWGAREVFQVKEGQMGLREDKKRFLIEHLGEDGANSVESHLEALGKELAGSGIRFKEVEPVMDEDDPEPKPDNGNGDGEPEPEPEPSGDEGGDAEDEERKELLELVTAVKEFHTGTTAAIDEMRQSIKAMDARIAEMEKSEEDKLVDRLMPRKAAVVAAQRPSQSDDNVVSDEVKEHLEDAKDAPTTPVSAYLEQLGVKV